MASGVASITLNPPLVGATLVLRYRSYDYDEEIIWQVTQEALTLFSGRNYTTYDLYQVQFPAQKIGGVWYDEVRTVRFQFDRDHAYILTPPARLGFSSEVSDINLPSALSEGVEITGDATITNIGDMTATFRCRVTHEWNGQVYLSSETELTPGSSLVAYLPDGVIMPDQDAVTTVQAERYYRLYPAAGYWEIDDVKSH